MKFHSIHGSNIVLDEGGCRAVRVKSFCDGITFSHKPLSINSRITLLLGVNEEWTGAVRLGVTTHDPVVFSAVKVPHYACPDLTSKDGYWARPLPEKWVAAGTRLTCYVNAIGQLHLFVNNEHKGAILVGLPVKEQLWLLLDLYGITVSAKFLSSSGSAPVEVIARGPDAVLAFQNAIEHGSTTFCQTRIMIIGPPSAGKTSLKKMLVKDSTLDKKENCGIDTECIFETSSCGVGKPWTLLKSKGVVSEAEFVNSSTNDNANGIDKILGNSSNLHQANNCPEEEYFQAIAANVVHEFVHRKKHTRDQRKTRSSKTGFKLNSNLSKIGPMPRAPTKQEENINSADKPADFDMPFELPSRVIELVNSMLKDNEKQVMEATNFENECTEQPVIRFNIWDYSGHPKFFIFHQLFLSPQTIYILVFDLSQELHSQVLSPEDYDALEYFGVPNLSPLTVIHMWLELIYICVSYFTSLDDSKDSESSTSKDQICSALPPVILVGTRKDAVPSVEQVQKQFALIKESLKGKIYSKHIVPQFFALHSQNSEGTLQELRKKVEELAVQLSFVGTEVPVKWILFEHVIDRLLDRQVFFTDLSKLSEVARLEGIESEEEFRSLVNFFHEKGKIWHLGYGILECKGIIVLNPQWFINYIYNLLNAQDKIHMKSGKNSIKENAREGYNSNVVSAEFFKSLWPDAYPDAFLLLDILDCADLVCEYPNPKGIASEDNYEKLYFLPWFRPAKIPKKDTLNKFDLVLDFSNVLPVGFCSRFLIRMHRWSQRYCNDQGGRKSKYANSFPIDYNHDISISKISSKRIKVSLSQNRLFDSDGCLDLYMSSHVCSKLCQLMVKEVEYLLDIWYKRLAFKLCVLCPCNKVCDEHSIPCCSENQCLHLLSLSKCLSKKVVECDYRLVKTDFIRKFFGNVNLEVFEDTADYKVNRKFSDELILTTPIAGRTLWEESEPKKEEPTWLKECSKMLTMSNTGRDWIALAKRLGYKEKEVANFQEDIYPATSFLRNWLESNGHTRYCTDLLVSCLQQMGRLDVIERIQDYLGFETPNTPVFISYQRDAQEGVLHLRRKLELAGYPCWMDVGHIHGGDSLYGKIYEGINQAKVVFFMDLLIIIIREETWNVDRFSIHSSVHKSVLRRT